MLSVAFIIATVHRGDAVREYLGTPGLRLRLVNLPGYRLAFNADEAVWGWVTEEATGNLCMGTKALVQERARTSWSGGLAGRMGRNGVAGSPPQSKAEEILQRPPSRFTKPRNCTSHLGFSVVAEHS